MATFTAISEKTQTATAMKKVLAYVIQEKKTLFHNEQTGQSYKLISGHNCVPETAYAEFMNTKEQYGKAKGVFFKQYVQSFKPDCGATPEQIHAMGVEMAKDFEGFEVVIATHIDVDHWHNHLVVNSVSCETGLKIQINEKGLERLRNRSDEICKAHGMEILEPYQKPKQRAMNQREYRAALRGGSWKVKLLSAIEKCIQASSSKDQFIANMQKLGYGVKWIDHYKYITYTTPEGQKCRDNRLYEDKYQKANMEGLFNEIKRTDGAERGNQRDTDRTVSANIDWSKTRAMERSDKAHHNGGDGANQEYGLNISAANTSGLGLSDGERNPAAQQGDRERLELSDKIYDGHDYSQVEGNRGVYSEVDGESELGYDELFEDAGYEPSQDKGEVGADWGDVALGAIALGAAIERMVTPPNEEHKQKKQKKKKGQGKNHKKSHAHSDFEMEM